MPLRLIEIIDYILKHKRYTPSALNLLGSINHAPYKEHVIKLLGKYGYLADIALTIEGTEVDCQKSSGLSDAHWAAANNDQNYFKKYGISCSDHDSNGMKPIDYAVQNSHYQLAEILSGNIYPQRNKDIAEKYHSGFSASYLPLHHALQKREGQWIEYFAQQKYPIMEYDYHGKNALHKAATVPGLEHFTWLACHKNVSGLDMQVKNKKNKNPYELALINKCYTERMQFPAQQLLSYELGRLTQASLPKSNSDNDTMHQEMYAQKALINVVNIPEVLCFIATKLVKDHFSNTKSRNPHNKIRMVLKDLKSLRLVSKFTEPVRDVRCVGKYFIDN